MENTNGEPTSCACGANTSCQCEPEEYTGGLEMGQIPNRDLEYWKNNAEEDYITTPISVLRYISELEKEVGRRYSEDDVKSAFQEMVKTMWTILKRTVGHLN